MIRRLFAQVLFLTRVPVPVKFEFREDDLAAGVIYAPLVGALIGLFPALLFLLLSESGLIFIAAASAVAMHVMVTGALHLDGFADTADGFFSNKSRERILEIMKDSRIGTNGAVALIMVLLLKFSTLISLPPGHAVLYLFAVPVASRMTIAWSAGLSVYARSERGMGSAIVERTGAREIVVSTLLTLFIVAAVFRFKLAVLPISVVASAACFAVLFSRYSNKKIGGVTGDVIGAVIELTEVLLLMLLLLFETLPGLRAYLP